MGKRAGSDECLWKNEAAGGDNDRELGSEGPTLGEEAREDLSADAVSVETWRKGGSEPGGCPEE